MPVEEMNHGSMYLGFPGRPATLPPEYPPKKKKAKRANPQVDTTNLLFCARCGSAMDGELCPNCRGRIEATSSE